MEHDVVQRVELLNLLLHVGGILEEVGVVDLILVGHRRCAAHVVDDRDRLGNVLGHLVVVGLDVHFLEGPLDVHQERPHLALHQCHLRIRGERLVFAHHARLHGLFELLVRALRNLVRGIVVGEVLLVVLKQVMYDLVLVIAFAQFVFDVLLEFFDCRFLFVAFQAQLFFSQYAVDLNLLRQCVEVVCLFLQQ